MLNNRTRLVAALAGLFAALPALASNPYSTITAAVDWSNVVTGIVAIAALVAAPKVVKAGSRMLLSMIRG